MGAIKLTLGSKLELELYDKNGERVMPLLVSQYETTSPDGTMDVLAPIHEGRIFPVHRDTRMDVIYERDGDLFKFSAAAIERKISGNVFLLTIKPLSNEERMQRRTFFRFNCLLDVEYRMFQDLAIPKEDRGAFKKAVTKDLSGGGLCLLANERPTYGWFLEGLLKIEREVRFIGKIVRVINIHDKGKFSYEIGIEFVEITNGERERVISFIFDSQRKLLKKGWSTK